MIESAESLIGKLVGERVRWAQQVHDLSVEIEALPSQTLLASAFVAYLAKCSEDTRKERLRTWQELVKIDKFDFRKFMTTETNQLRWKSEARRRLRCDALTNRHRAWLPTRYPWRMRS